VPVVILIIFVLSWAGERFAASPVCIEVSSTLFSVGRQVCVEVAEVVLLCWSQEVKAFPCGNFVTWSRGLSVHRNNPVVISVYL